MGCGIIPSGRFNSLFISVTPIEVVDDGSRELLRVEQINVLVVDDSLVIRGMIVNILEKDPQITVVGAAANAADADTLLRQHLVDVVTLDIEMPGLSGMDYLPSLARRRIPTVMLSGQTVEGSEERSWALRQGASACFNKAHAVRDAADLIKQVKDAARRSVRLSAQDAAALTGTVTDNPETKAAIPAEPGLEPGADVAPAASADQLNSARTVADRLVRQHGASAMNVLVERVGQMALRGDLKHIDTWRSIASSVEHMLAGNAQKHVERPSSGI